MALTCEAQAQSLPSDVNGALSKNLFLKDKKGKFYLLSACVATKVDMKSTVSAEGLCLPIIVAVVVLALAVAVAAEPAISLVCME